MVFETMNNNCPRILFKPVSSYQFEPREVFLNEPCKIGRAVGKIKPHRNNAIFDCKVLSRNHAIIWYENGKFFLKDTKSSNGTFANKRRLSEACEESEPYEIFSNDQIQFGVDVTDNLIVHPCIITQISVFHSDGKEAFHNSVTLSQRDMHKLNQILEEAKNKEQSLSQKQKQFDLVLEDILNSTSESWKAMVDEESLLSRILVLETELEIYRKPLEKDDLKKQLLDLTCTKYEEEMYLKNKLSQLYEEKVKIEANIECLQDRIVEKINENEHINRLLSEANEEVESLGEAKTFLQEELNNVQNHLQQVEIKYKEALDEIEQKEEVLKSLDRECLREQIDVLQAQVEGMKGQKAHKRSLSASPQQPPILNSAGDDRNKFVIASTAPQQLSATTKDHSPSPRHHHFVVRDISSSPLTGPEKRAKISSSSASPPWFRDGSAVNNHFGVTTWDGINPTFFSPLNDNSLIANGNLTPENAPILNSSTTDTKIYDDTYSPPLIFSMDDATLSGSFNSSIAGGSTQPPQDHRDIKKYISDFNRTFDDALVALDDTCNEKIKKTTRKVMECLTHTNTFVSKNRLKEETKKANEKENLKAIGTNHIIKELRDELIKKEHNLKKETEKARAKVQESDNLKLLLTEEQRSHKDKDQMVHNLKENFDAANTRYNKVKQENDTLRAQLYSFRDSILHNNKNDNSKNDFTYGSTSTLGNSEAGISAEVMKCSSSSYDKLFATSSAGSLDTLRAQETRGLFGNEEELDRISHNYQELAYQTKVRPQCVNQYGTADPNDNIMHVSFSWQSLFLNEPYRFFNQFFHNTNNVTNATTLAIFLALLAFLAFIILNYQ